MQRLTLELLRRLDSSLKHEVAHQAAYFVRIAASHYSTRERAHANALRVLLSSSHQSTGASIAIGLQEDLSYRGLHLSLHEHLQAVR